MEGLKEAVVIATRSFVRHERLVRFRALRGKVDIISNEEIEAADLERNGQLWGDPHSDETRDQIHPQTEPESRTALLQRLQGQLFRHRRKPCGRTRRRAAQRRWG